MYRFFEKSFANNDSKNLENGLRIEKKNEENLKK